MSENFSKELPLFLRHRRVWFLFLLIWLGSVLLAFHIHRDNIRSESENLARESARGMFKLILLTRQWNSHQGGIYVRVTDTLKPNPYLRIEDRDKTTTDGIQLTLLNPAYMTRLLADMSRLENGPVFRVTSLKPIRPGNIPDAWEAEALLAFEKTAHSPMNAVSPLDREYISILEEKGQKLLRFMAPLYVDEVCLKCHEEQGYRVGDLRGGISVTQLYAPVQKSIDTALYRATWTYAAVFFLTTALVWLLLEMLRHRWLALIFNIEERKRVEARLQNSEKIAAVGHLAASIAHQLDAPINQVASLWQALSADLINPKEFSAAFALPAAEVAQVKTVLEKLKNFSEGRKAAREKISLSDVLNDTLTLLREEALQKEADIVRVYSEIPAVIGNGTQVAYVMENLLHNALDAISPKGKIIIRTGQETHFVWFEIGDNGEGIAEEAKEKIFDPFYTTRNNENRAGLGLSIAKDIVLRHQGRIDYQSTRGQGSTFRVYLPMHEFVPESHLESQPSL